MQSSRQSEITHEVIESVVHLTEQRDELTLLRSLQQSILEMLPGVQVAMVCLTPGPDGCWATDATCPMPIPMFSLSDAVMAEIVGLEAEKSIRQHAEGGQVCL